MHRYKNNILLRSASWPRFIVLLWTTPLLIFGQSGWQVICTLETTGNCQESAAVWEDAPHFGPQPLRILASYDAKIRPP